MKLSQYVLDFLVKQGIGHVFLITGGAIAFQVDAFHGRKDIEYVYTAHEQAAAMMAESYARHKGLGCAMATSGPGATNLITGICCAWFDSIPTLYITGQVSPQDSKGDSKVRQMGFQETDIVSMVRPITKYAKLLAKPNDIGYELEKAVCIAKSGRPGPVLIDIPMDYQKAEIGKQRKYTSFRIDHNSFIHNKAHDKFLNQIVTDLENAERPVLIAGGGIKRSGAEKWAHSIATKLQIPVVSSWSAYDVFERRHPLYRGAFGVYGERGANFTVQNADFILSVGSRLDTRQTGTPKLFAREARVTMIDIDKSELMKNKGFKPYRILQADAATFLSELDAKITRQLFVPEWVKKSKDWCRKYPIVDPKWYEEKTYVNSYVFMRELSKLAPSNSVIIPDDGGHLTWAMQAWEVKKGQSMYSAFGNSPMGYSFPAAIGASFATKRPIICIGGDGSFQINIQELTTLKHYQPNVKIFILDNQGYGIIKQFQGLYLGGRETATNPPIPDFVQIARAYGIAVEMVNDNSQLYRIEPFLKYRGPAVCVVNIKPDQKLIPKVEYGKPIEDLSPLLPRDEFVKNMIVKTV